MFDETNQFVLNFGGGGYSIITGMTTEFDSGTIQVRVTPEPVGVGFLGILGMLVYAKRKLLV